MTAGDILNKIKQIYPMYTSLGEAAKKEETKIRPPSPLELNGHISGGDILGFILELQKKLFFLSDQALTLRW